MKLLVEPTLIAVTGLLVLLSVPLATPAEAGQEWELISVTRGATWEVNQAKGALKQNGAVLEGVLRDKADGKADYQIRIKLNGEHAEATFRFISENDAGTTLTGIYKKAPKPTDKHCPEQIQLMNSFQYIGLARDACEPSPIAPRPRGTLPEPTQLKPDAGKETSG